MPMIPVAQDGSFKKKVEVSSSSSYIAARSGRALCKQVGGQPRISSLSCSVLSPSARRTVQDALVRAEGVEPSWAV
jgi:hypothetical protein